MSSHAVTFYFGFKIVHIFQCTEHFLFNVEGQRTELLSN